MRPVYFVDFETYYDKEYTLRKLTPIEYVLDNRFECLGMAVQHSRKGVPYWVTPDRIRQWILSHHDHTMVIVSHNALFDMLILAWRYNYIPPNMLDTLGMSRALLGHLLKSLSLDSVSRHLGIGAKGDTVASKMSGIHRVDLARMPELEAELKAYACDDVNKCARIFYHLIEEFPASEAPLMDMVLRACVAPQFKLDRARLLAHHEYVLEQKRIALADAGVADAKLLRSDASFAALLEALGVDPPTKLSPITGRKAYAFAKTDSAFIDLADHEDPKVQALVSARLGHKTTLEESRTQRLLSISNLKWPVGSRWMPIPLGYGRAHTHRLGGDMKLNMQNLPRGGALRKALVSPVGTTVVSIDLSQIEARIVAWLCEQLDLLEAFALGRDVYSEFASDVFKKPVSKTENPTLRFIGKTAILGLGYSMSWQKFILALKALSKNQLGTALEITETVARKVVERYRTLYRHIQNQWGILEVSGIQALLKEDTLFMLGPCAFRKGAITLPNGLKLYYHNLTVDPPSASLLRGQTTFSYGGKTKPLYGAKLLENCTQALARLLIMDIALRVRPQVGDFAHQVHDELIYVVRNENVGAVCETLLAAARVIPEWAAGLPVAAEVKVGPSYGELH